MINRQQIPHPGPAGQEDSGSVLSGVHWYSCFISYRHSDNRGEGEGRPAGREWASWLHQLIESYDIPADMRPLRGSNRMSLYPVFQDEMELPADADLSAPIRAALEVSDCLLVICSPQAAQSRFVAEEILHYKRVGRSSRILALIIAGEPNADDPAKARLRITPEDECFPLPLRHPLGPDGQLDLTQRIEPLAADVRLNALEEGFTSAEAYRDFLAENGAYSAKEIRRRTLDYGKKLDLARLKILAGIIRVPVNELSRRDTVRAHRLARTKLRWTLAACVSLLLLLGWALVERHRAESALVSLKERSGKLERLEKIVKNFEGRVKTESLTSEERQDLEFLLRDSGPTANQEAWEKEIADRAKLAKFIENAEKRLNDGDLPDEKRDVLKNAAAEATQLADAFDKKVRYIAVNTVKEANSVGASQVMIYDVNSNQVVGNNVYDLKTVPKVGQTSKFDTYTAEYFPSGS